MAYTLESPDGRCLATVVPDLAMLCWSLTLDGEEYVGRPNSLAAFARDWATTGIPLLHPWANRLGGDRIVGVAEATIPPTSRLVPRDERGLAIHGLNLADAGWVGAGLRRRSGCPGSGTDGVYRPRAPGDLSVCP